MASINDLNALIAGTYVSPTITPGFNSAVGVGGQQVVVLNQGQGGCLPCGTETCPTITPIQTSPIDIGQILGSVPSCTQFDVVNGTEVPRYLTFGGPEDTSELARYALTGAKYFDPAVNAFGTAAGTFTTNGHGFALDVQYLNTVLQQGTVVCSIEINSNTTDSAANTALVNSPLTTLSIPVSPVDNVCTKTEFPPFCSACVTTDNSGFITKLYTLSAPTGNRSAIALLFPVGATATVKICWAYIAIENTALSSAEDQF